MYKVLPLVILQCLLLTAGQVFLKFALMRMAPFGWNRTFWSSVFLNWQFAACGLCFLVASLLWMYIVKTFPFSVAYPMISMSFVVGMIAAVVFFHEQVSWTKWVGVLLIIAGCLLIAGPVQAQDAKAARQHIVEAAQRMKTMQCDFVQTKHTKLLADATASKGRLSYRQPDWLCWEYTSPTVHTFTIDGEKVLMSDSRRTREVDIRRNRMYREMARLMTNIMSGQSLVGDQDFQVTLAAADEKKTEWVATLVPRRKEVRRMYASIILRVTPAYRFIMILKNSLYTIEGQQSQEGTVSYDIRLHSDHFIYQAHFPGEPITPGVCVVQIAKELLEEHLQRPLAIKAVKNVKFLAVVSPLEHPQVRYTFRQIQDTPEAVTAQVDVADGDTSMTAISFTCA